MDNEEVVIEPRARIIETLKLAVKEIGLEEFARYTRRDRMVVERWLRGEEWIPLRVLRAACDINSRNPDAPVYSKVLFECIANVPFKVKIEVRKVQVPLEAPPPPKMVKPWRVVKTRFSWIKLARVIGKRKTQPQEIIVLPPPLKKETKTAPQEAVKIEKMRLKTFMRTIKSRFKFPERTEKPLPQVLISGGSLLAFILLITGLAGFFIGYAHGPTEAAKGAISGIFFGWIIVIIIYISKFLKKSSRSDSPQ